MKRILAVLTMMLTALTISNSNAKDNEMTDKKVLVAYFSATGTTAGVAERLAKAISGDLFEIKPEQPYTAADLNWRDKQSRSSVEMDDMSSRPAIASKVEDMSRYNVVFVGFPIWWYREPSIIDTFMESYDFTDKTIIPFATSGGSGMGKSGEIMQSLSPKAKVLSGKRFPADVSEDELKAWAKEWL
ncbi:MAG: flavodoxin [Alphaproteobacteria bacterium]|nr:flavodoxin [Alphaproteobacteria bacterium]MBP1532076.1 flavodoxin [Alphaproteobacteria bacterium]